MSELGGGEFNEFDEANDNSDNSPDFSDHGPESQPDEPEVPDKPKVLDDDNVGQDKAIADVARAGYVEVEVSDFHDVRTARSGTSTNVSPYHRVRYTEFENDPTRRTTVGRTVTYIERDEEHTESDDPVVEDDKPEKDKKDEGEPENDPDSTGDKSPDIPEPPDDRSPATRPPEDRPDSKPEPTDTPKPPDASNGTEPTDTPKPSDTEPKDPEPRGDRPPDKPVPPDSRPEPTDTEPTDIPEPPDDNPPETRPTDIPPDSRPEPTDTTPKPPDTEPTDTEPTDTPEPHGPEPTDTEPRGDRPPVKPVPPDGRPEPTDTPKPPDTEPTDTEPTDTPKPIDGGTEIDRPGPDFPTIDDKPELAPIDRPRNWVDIAGGVEGADDVPTLDTPERFPDDVEAGIDSSRHIVNVIGEKLDDELWLELLEELRVRRDYRTSPQFLGLAIDPPEDLAAQIQAIRQALLDFANLLEVDVQGTALNFDQHTLFTPEQFAEMAERTKLRSGAMGGYVPEIEHSIVVCDDDHEGTLVRVQRQDGYGASYSCVTYRHTSVETDNGDKHYFHVVSTQIGFAVYNDGIWLGAETADSDNGNHGSQMYSMFSEVVGRSMTEAIVEQEWPKHPELAEHVDESLQAGSRQAETDGSDTNENMAEKMLQLLTEVMADRLHIPVEEVKKKLYRAQLTGDIAAVEVLLAEALGQDGRSIVEQWSSRFDTTVYEYVRSLTDNR